MYILGSYRPPFLVDIYHGYDKKLRSANMYGLLWKYCITVMSAGVNAWRTAKLRVIGKKLIYWQKIGKWIDSTMEIITNGWF